MSNARLNPEEVQVSIFYPYEKTRLFEICREQGLEIARQVPDPFRETALSFPPPVRSQVLFSALYFRLLVRVYGLFYRLPPVGTWLLVRVSDHLLSARLMARIGYPALIGLHRSILRHRWLEGRVRQLARWLLNRS